MFYLIQEKTYSIILIMSFTKIMLWGDNIPYYNDEYGQKPYIEIYSIDDDLYHDAILICPGGGYQGLAKSHEGIDVAKWANSIGYHAIVLTYRVKPYAYPSMLLDALRAMKLVRHHSDKYMIDKVGILGFSAGGHLASSVSTHYLFNDGQIDSIDDYSTRPDFAILCYPVISFTQSCHEGSRQNFTLGYESLYSLFSNELQVDENTPPTFIWHTAEDRAVPVNNSLLYASSLAKYNVEFSLMIYPKGEHGLGLAYDTNLACNWSVECKKWLKSINIKGDTV